MSSPAPSPRSAAGDPDHVDLTDLEIIRRYSLVVRQGSAGRAEVLAALRSDVERLERSSRSSRTAGASARPSPQAASKTPSKRPAAKRAPAKRTARG